ncbi:glutamate-rich protein 2 isoform X2 [Hyperolius riggenbachi]|uniref:glutamate-rich protein 2 isoform X2 n=1 Tax=Hyperolius riggenbachi TaxID=752182 RepID=UPI0035A31EC5
MSRTGLCTEVRGGKAFGKLEVLDPEDAESPKNTIFQTSCPPDVLVSATKRPINLQNGKLQVLGPTEDVSCHLAEAALRPGSSSGRQASSGRRSYTPTKQISLCTVKPKAHSSNIPNYHAADITDFKESKKSNTGPLKEDSVHQNNGEKHPKAEVLKASNHNPEMPEQPEDSSSDEEESDEEKPHAPMELLAEFLEAVMNEDYKLAWKLCQMILLYEPENPEVKEFSPLIQKMLKREEEEEEEGSDEEDSEDDSEDTDEDKDSSDSDYSNKSSTESESDEC